MAFNYAAMQKTASKLIRKFGMPAKLLRTVNGQPVYRDCIAVETGFTPGEERGKLSNPTDRVFLIDAKELTQAPNLEAGDVLVTFTAPSYTQIDDKLKIRVPTGRMSPAGVVVYYELQVYR